jgi:hypothetical protein
VAQLNSALSAASHGVVDAALETPGHVNVTVNGGHSEGLPKFVLLDGRGNLVSSNMTALAPNKTYQLWGIIGGKPISIGLIGTKPTTVYFSIAGCQGTQRTGDHHQAGGRQRHRINIADGWPPVWVQRRTKSREV